MDKIPFNQPYLVGKEFEYMERAMATLHVSGDGHFTKQCHTSLQEILGVSKVLLTTSCTHALELAALLLDLGCDDEVIVPSFTFVSTVNAFALRGVRPVFIDIRPDTLNLNELLLERVITSRTKAIVPVHYAGVGCEMSAIVDIALRHGITIVEDNAHGLFGKYRGKYLGTFGHLATQSFHQTKNLYCGEGGALLINDLRYGERAEILREKGTDRNRFFRGEVDKYTWVDIGSSYLPSDLLAAFLYAQLEAREFIQTQRKRVWEAYYDQLRDWAGVHGVKLPMVPAYCEQTYHMFYVLLPSEPDRDALIKHLKKRSISAVFHYLPLHLSAMGRRFGGRTGDFPVTEDVSARLLRLPFYTGMTEEEQSTVISALKAFVGWQNPSSRAQTR